MCSHQVNSQKSRQTEAKWPIHTLLVCTQLDVLALQELSDADLGDNKPNFPTPDVNTSQNQDIFKQLGDKVSLPSLQQSLSGSQYGHSTLCLAIRVLKVLHSHGG